MKKLILLLSCFCFVAASNKKLTSVDCRVRAKQIADSIIYTYVPKNIFLKFYKFDSKYSNVTFYSSNLNDIEKNWLTTINTKPSQYYLTYNLINEPPDMIMTNHDVSIVLDSSYKRVDLYGLIDIDYLKPFINAVKLNSIKKSLANSAFDLILDSIPNKITVRPFFELRSNIKTIDDDEHGCMWLIDTCLKIDPYTGKTVTTYTRSMSHCF